MNVVAEMKLISGSPSYLKLCESAEPEEWSARHTLNNSSSLDKDGAEHRRDILWNALSTNRLVSKPPRAKSPRRSPRNSRRAEKSSDKDDGSDKETKKKSAASRSNSGPALRRRKITPTSIHASETMLPPGVRVKLLLNRANKESTTSDPNKPPAYLESHKIFSELRELHDASQWKESARWIKFEEKVEACANRWSRPHIASLSLHSLFELRASFMNGVVLLNVTGVSTFEDVISEITHHLHSIQLATFEECLQIKTTLRMVDPNYVDAFSKRSPSKASVSHRISVDFSLMSQSPKSALKRVRSLADRRKQSISQSLKRHQKASASTPLLEKTSPEAVKKSTSINDVSSSMLCVNEEHWNKFDEHFTKKLPEDAEAAAILVGEVGYLSKPAAAFLRLQTPCKLPEISEVPLATRFVFVLFGPKGQANCYREVGRALGTLFADEVFHEVAYKARATKDLLDGIDEFMDQVTVLPPSEWDPNIRIEPPSTLPSQNTRKGLTEEERKKKKEEEETERAREESRKALKFTKKMFGGLMADFNRKLKFYVSDLKDGLNVQTFATALGLYFAVLAQAVVFGRQLDTVTNGQMGVLEALAGAVVCGFIYSLCAGQPLTVLGISGSLVIFEKIVFSSCRAFELNYLGARFWIGIWCSIFLLAMTAFNLSSLLNFVTRFIRENFRCTMSFIFIWEAVQAMYAGSTGENRVSVYPTGFNRTCKCFNDTTATAWLTDALLRRIRKNVTQFPWLSQPQLNRTARPTYSVSNHSMIPLKFCEQFGGTFKGNSCYKMHDLVLMCVVLMSAGFFLAFALKQFRHAHFFSTSIRKLISEFSLTIAIVILTLFDAALRIKTPKIDVPSVHDYSESNNNNDSNYLSLYWPVNPFANPAWLPLFAAIPAVFLCIMLFLDQQLTSLIVNRREHRLKKSFGYHLDLLVISLLVFISASTGLPFFVASTILSIHHVDSLRVKAPSTAAGGRPIFIGCREQRLSTLVAAILLALSFALTDILNKIPLPIMYGIFVYMGIRSFNGVQLVDRFLLILMPMKYQPDHLYIRNVRINRVHLFTILQLGCVSALLVTKTMTYTALFFPIAVAKILKLFSNVVVTFQLIGTIGLRKLIEIAIFDKNEIRYLGDKMPAFRSLKKQAKEKDMPFIREAMKLFVPLPSGNILTIAYNFGDQPTRLSQYKEPSISEVTLENSSEYDAEVPAGEGGTQPREQTNVDLEAYCENEVTPNRVKNRAVNFSNVQTRYI